MKTLKYILLAILLGINLVSCEAPPIQDEVGITEVETIATGDQDIEEEVEEDIELKEHSDLVLTRNEVDGKLMDAEFQTNLYNSSITSCKDKA